jgi:hypothetical protein
MTLLSGALEGALIGAAIGGGAGLVIGVIRLIRQRRARGCAARQGSGYIPEKVAETAGLTAAAGLAIVAALH